MPIILEAFIVAVSRICLLLSPASLEEWHQNAQTPGNKKIVLIQKLHLTIFMLIADI